MEKCLYRALFVIILVSFSCRNNYEIEVFPNAIKLNINEVEHIHLKDGELIELSPLMKVNQVYVYDSMLVILGPSTVNDYSAHIYNPHDGSLLKSFARYGRGPAEFTRGVSFFQLLPGSRQLYTFDRNSRATVVFNIDSLLGGKTIPCEINSHLGIDYYLHYKFGEMEYLFFPVNYGLFGYDGSTLMLGKYSFKRDVITNRVSFPDIVGFDSTLNLLHQSTLFPIHPDRNINYHIDSDRLVMLYYAMDVLDVYDSNLELKVRIHGPDRSLPEIGFSDLIIGPGGLGMPGSEVFSKARTVSDVLVFEGSTRLGYDAVRTYSGGFYVLYGGGLVSDDHKYSMLLYFSYCGAPVRYYTFDKLSDMPGSYSVDESKGILYVVGSDGELYRYKLPD